MKTLILVFGLAGILAFSLWNYDTKEKITIEDNADKEIILISAVRQYLDRFHYSPKELNDSLSEDIFNLYLERIDGSKRFLTLEDIEGLEPYRYRIDDEILGNSIEFFNLSVKVIGDAMSRSKEIYDEITDKDFDFHKKEQTEMNPEKREFAADVEELKDYWRKYIKSDVLSRAVGLLEKQQAENYDGEVLSREEILNKSIEKSKETFEKWWTNLDRVRRADWFNMYLNSITNVYDPHTGFFRPKDKEDFDMRLSKRLEGIGAQLTMDGNYTKVVNLVPGGPAWKQGKLKADDLILKVEQENEIPIDVVGMHIDDVVSMIRGEKGSSVTLHVKHVDGSLEEITIERDVIEFEEGYAKSLILEDSSRVQKIGYINLPSFYTNLDNSTARTSSTDVKRELEKLKNNSVQGIILDLRNNGGGSLRDVVDMAGLFIESGPIVQVKSRRGKPYVLKDSDPNVVYDGPLIVLVNHFSASASEIMAAAMQDYGRGVIVGATSTFGKGTVQRFYDLDQGLSGHSEFKPLGSVKITTQKYYRINGGSVQLKGIIPDIILPERYNRIDVGEKDYDYVMDWSEIPAAKYSQSAYSYDIPALKKKSDARVSENQDFILLDEESRYIEERKNETTISLDIDEYILTMEEQDERKKYFERNKTELLGIGIINLPSDIQHIESDSVNIARNDALIKDVKKDLYISESLNIMYDILHPDKGVGKE